MNKEAWEARSQNKGSLLASGLPGQVPVLDSMRLVCCRTKAGAPVRFIIRVISFEPDDAAVAFKS